MEFNHRFHFFLGKLEMKNKLRYFVIGSWQMSTVMCLFIPHLSWLYIKVFCDPMFLLASVICILIRLIYLSICKVSPNPNLKAWDVSSTHKVHQPSRQLYSSWVALGCLARKLVKTCLFIDKWDRNYIFAGTALHHNLYIL